MKWPDLIREHRDVIDFIERDMQPAIDAVAEMLIERIDAGNKLLIAGNGGSAADSQHFACELVNQFLIKNSRPWPALALTTDSSILTSVVNDHNGIEIFGKQIQAFGQPGDVFMAISTSGSSPNLVHAADLAKQGGLVTVGLLGGEGGQLQNLVDHALTIRCTKHVPRIQEGHLLIIHALCERIEEVLHERDAARNGTSTTP